ncbi:MAG: hypothetical protein U9N72_09475 [Bacteroidota bacterium]|nr:hypothetical protein [Bacteroidota bacterium]
MEPNNKYQILFTKLEEAIKEQEEEYQVSYELDPIENERIRELSEICDKLSDENVQEEYSSFTRS